MKAFQYILVLLIALTSCIKDMEINSDSGQSKVVVKCLFSEDDNWDLTLLTTKSIDDNTDEYVENATVEILSESGQSIVLNYEGEGHYTSASRPTAGITYQLKINVPGVDEITAESAIPPVVVASVDDLEISWMKYMYPNDLMDYDVFPLTVHFEEPVSDAWFLFRAHSFDPEFGYTRYKLPSSALDGLQEQGIPAKGIERLAHLADKWQTGTQVFFDRLDGFGNWEESAYYTNLVNNALLQKKVATREYVAFLRENCFSDDDWLTNISYDTNTVLGHGTLVENAGLLYSDPSLKYAMETENPYLHHYEYWVEVTRGSLEYYEYYRTYILQVSQRLNPYSEPVQVYSNIKNGVGIFAGYHRQMIHLFNY